MQANVGVSDAHIHSWVRGGAVLARKLTLYAMPAPMHGFGLRMCGANINATTTRVHVLGKNSERVAVRGHGQHRIRMRIGLRGGGYANMALSCVWALRRVVDQTRAPDLPAM